MHSSNNSQIPSKSLRFQFPVQGYGLEFPWSAERLGRVQGGSFVAHLSTQPRNPTLQTVPETPKLPPEEP